MSRIKTIFNHSTDKHNLPELLVYIAVWSIVLLFPVVSSFFEYLSGTVDAMRWRFILMQWRDVLPFFILFLINNNLLLPRLFLRQRVGLYVVFAILLTMLVMSAVSLLDAASFKERRQDRELWMQSGRREQTMRRPDKGETRPLPSDEPGQFPPPRDFNEDFPRLRFENRPFFFPLMRGPFFGRLLMTLLMLSFNIAVKLFFKSRRDKETMKELEHHNLQSELDYLKYQINPHFFMNTLNNIHALVDIDTEKAKQTIVELSKLMRYMLYEADKRTISLTKEVHFLRHYIELMRIRYPESVHIDLSIPEDTGEIQVPPLLFISFVENAFKHGISYQADSLISVKMEVKENEIIFRCTNSNFGKNEDQYHGIGLENIRKRLQLLYGERYTLSINEKETCFEVLMVVPIE